MSKTHQELIESITHTNEISQDEINPPHPYIRCSNGGVAMAQRKKSLEWKEGGSRLFMSYKDTTYQNFESTKKDSSAVILEKSDCNCAVFSIKVNNKTEYLPCDSLIKSHYVTQNYSYQYYIKKYKGITIEKSKPEWVQTWGMSRNDDYIYYSNNRRVWPLEFFKQPINN